MPLNKKILSIGCGRRPENDRVNLDIVALPGVDVVHDLEVMPYPFKDGQFDKIIAEDVLEHVTNIIGIMDELWRILKMDGILWIRGPHANYPEQVWKDPTHKRAFSPETFDNWDPSTRLGKTYGFYYGTAKFRVVNQREVNKGMEYTLIKIKK